MKAKIKNTIYRFKAMWRILTSDLYITVTYSQKSDYANITSKTDWNFANMVENSINDLKWEGKFDN